MCMSGPKMPPPPPPPAPAPMVLEQAAPESAKAKTDKIKKKAKGNADYKTPNAASSTVGASVGGIPAGTIGGIKKK